MFHFLKTTKTFYAGMEVDMLALCVLLDFGSGNLQAIVIGMLLSLPSTTVNSAIPVRSDGRFSLMMDLEIL